MEGKCCGFIKGVIITLLILNTFFLGSIWCKVVVQSNGGVCFLGKSKVGKFCPLTGKPISKNTAVRTAN